MKRKSYLISTILFLLLSIKIIADEGMWIPSAIPDSILKNMLQMGLKLNKYDIYTPDSTDLLDAVPRFGKGCSSGMISDDGLLITNYHCARYFIQNHSTIDNNLFEKGFVAYSNKEELTNPGLTVEFTQKIIDVTDSVLKGVNSQSTIIERDSIIARNITLIEKKYRTSITLTAEVESFFFGSKFLLFIKEEFKDIRLVFCPPEDIAIFGGETDNWIWPRHSADFAIFRVYSDSTNLPNKISQNNIPFKPRKWFKLSQNEQSENDFALVIGYPGQTEEYLPPEALKQYKDSILPIRLLMRQKRMDIMKHYMDISKDIKLNYSYKYASLSNYYLKWQSDKKHLDMEPMLIESKNKVFDPKIKSEIEQLYNRLGNMQKNNSFFQEGILSMDIIKFANKLNYSILNGNNDIKDILSTVRTFYKTNSKQIDIEYFKWFIKNINSISIDKELTEFIFENELYPAKRKTDEKLEQLFKNTILLDSTRLIKILLKNPMRVLEKLNQDHIYTIADKTVHLQRINEQRIFDIKNKIDSLQRVNLEYLLSQNKPLYPDANSTIRLSYGNISSYNSKDGITYNYKSTIQGIIEKNISGDTCYSIQEKSIFYRNPKITSCFISDCHTSGGNSGSPVLDNKGLLIGVNFDRNIEGTVNDYVFRENIGRNIWVSIKYIKFILDNFATNATFKNKLYFSY